MAVTSENGVTKLTPTAWKWFVGAGVSFFFIPGFGILLALVFILMGAGVMQRLTLSPDGLEVRNWFSTKSYAWSEISDFRIHKVKSGLITAANMIAFSHAEKSDTMMGKAAKFLVGGTHTVPALGLPPKKLVQLMQAYKQGFAPGSSGVAASAPQPVPVPATPRTVSAPSRTARRAPQKPVKTKPARPHNTPLVQEGGGLLGRRRSDSPFSS